MPSRSLQEWQKRRQTPLRELRDAHRQVGGLRRGRRWATRQINHAYAVVLASQFQGFCRDLHEECVSHCAAALLANSVRLSETVSAASVRWIAGMRYETISRDFRRFRTDIWRDGRSLDPQTQMRQNMLEDLNSWRNAIAHDDFTHPAVAGKTMTLHQVTDYHRACNRLAVTFDAVMRTQLNQLLGSWPW